MVSIISTLAIIFINDSIYIRPGGLGLEIPSAFIL